MRIPKDILTNTAKVPEVYLCQVDKEIIGGLRNITNFNYNGKFNAYSEISMEVPRIYIHPITGEYLENPLYKYVEALRLIYVVGFGFFEIQQAGIVSDGIFEYKDLVAYSLEYQLSQKYLEEFVINYGTVESIDGVKLLSQAGISHSLIHLVLEKVPNWSVGHVDLSVQDRQRSFEVDSSTIYDFLMNDMEDTFGIVIDYDTENNTVNIYDEETYSIDSNVFISKDNLAQEIHVDYSADDIKTLLNIYGQDDLSIREVNLGLPYVMDLSYYATSEWMGKDLYDAYKSYCELTAGYQEEYSELMLEWSALYDQWSELYNRVPDYDDNYDDSIPTVYSKSDLPTASEKNVYMIYRVVEGDATWYYKCQSERVDDTTVYRWVLDVDNISSFYTFPTPSEEYADLVVKVYNQESTNGVLYYVCKVIESPSQENNWTTKYGWILANDKYGINLLKEKEQCYLDIQEIHVSAGYAEKDNENYPRYLENYEKLIEIQTQLKEEEARAAALQSQLDEVTAKMAIITNAIQVEKNFTPEQIKKLNSFIREDTLTDDNFLVTELDDDKSAMEIKRELMESGQRELKKISQPQLSFSMGLANLLALPEFEPIVNEFNTGATIMVEIRPGYIVKTQILEVQINFDDMSDFNVTFGNLTSLHSEIDKHAALLSQAVTAGKSVAQSGSYWKKGADTANSINNRIDRGLIDANTSIKSTENQAISWDSHGFHLRKYRNEEKTDYYDDQIWMNNEKIVFTDDNWRTAKMAIGKFKDSELGEVYGIIAPNIVGTLLAGENLVIDSSKPDGTLSSFRVDSTGARLYNSQFLMEKEVTKPDGTKSNGQIMIDPQYGIVAGSDVYITNSDGTVSPSFVNSDGTIQKDGIFPINSNFFLDINDGNAYFRGYVYAQDGYFSGTITSATVESATGNFSGNITATSGDIGGWIVKKGILYSTGVGSSEKNFVGISSKYDFNDGTTNYAFWAGAKDPASAPFSVQRDGTVAMKSGNISCSINVGNGNFTVDENGNVTMNGDINMSGASSLKWGGIMYQYSSDNVNWHDIRQSNDIYRRESFDSGETWEEGYQFIGKNGSNGSDASVTYSNIKSALNRASKAAMTFITGSTVDTANIYASEIYGGKIYAGDGESTYAYMDGDSFALKRDGDTNDRAILSASNNLVQLILGTGSSSNSSTNGRLYLQKGIASSENRAGIYYTTTSGDTVGFTLMDDGGIIVHASYVNGLSSTAVFG